LYKGGSEQQVLCGIATQGELGGQQQTHPLGVRSLGCIQNFLGISSHVAHHEIELSHSEF
jgi:hypothetical protein